MTVDWGPWTGDESLPQTMPLRYLLILTGRSETDKEILWGIPGTAGSPRDGVVGAGSSRRSDYVLKKGQRVYSTPFAPHPRRTKCPPQQIFPCPCPLPLLSDAGGVWPRQV